MKKITFCFAVLLMAVFSSFGQVQLGDGTSVDKGLPFEPSKTYSYGQSIYLASEILATGSITSLEWYYAGPYDLAGSQELTVYVGHTTKSVFASSSDWEAVGNLTEVYSGGIAVNGAGWTNIEFDAPFAYNGIDNLVIAVVETSAGTDFGEDDFYTYQVTGNRSLARSSYDVVQNPANPGNGTRSAFVPNIQLNGITQACTKPINVVASDPTTSGISLSWESIATSTGGSQYFISTSNTIPSPTATPTGNVTSGEFAVVETGLLPATKYYAWVRDVCETGPGTWSNSTSFTTACEPAALFYQDFNDAANGTVPVCWSTIAYNPQGNATPSKVEVTDENGYTESSVQFYRNGDAASTLILVSPALSNLGAGTHRLRFFAKNFTFSPIGGFKIGTMDDNSMDANFNEIGEFAISTNFVEYTVDFTSVTTDDVYIGIKLNSTNENYLGYIDNIRWEVAPLCPDVSQIGIPSVTPTTATVAWTADEELSAWEVVYGTAATADPNTLTPISNVLENPTTLIEELTAETTYYVWVRSKCEAGAGLWVGPVSFKTPCQPVNTLNENFDSVTGTNLPNCWSKILRGETLSSYASIKTVLDGANSPPRALELYSGFSNPAASDDIILVSPNLGNLAAGTHRLKFHAKAIEVEGNLEIGTLSGNTIASEFSTLQMVPISVNGMAEYVVDFASYVDSNTFIGFRFNTTSSFKTLLIDDIIWEASPSCPDVNDISFSETTPSSTTVGWSTSEATQWQIVYGATSVSDPNTLTPSEILTAPSAELTDLSSNTTYKIWVRSVCGETDGNGAWSYPVFVTTACDPVNTFSENFETAIDPNLPSCWSSITTGNTSVGGVGLITWQPYAGSIGVEIYANSTSISTAPILVSPALGNLGAATNRLRFYAKHSDTANLEVGTVGPDGITFTPLQLVELTDTYQEYTVDFTTYSGTDKHIGFRILTTATFKSVGLDNIVWEVAPSCANVTDIAVTEITTATADVTWTAGSNETGWQYVYAESTVLDPATLTPSATLEDENVVLIGLTSGVYYNVWVRSVCNSTSFGSWVGPVTFLTKCLAANLPYAENFESVVVPNLPNCSSIFNSVDAVNWETANSPGNGFSSKALSYGPNETNSGGAWFFTRGVNLTAGENYVISYKYGNNSAGLHESLLVKYGTAETVEGMTMTIADHDVTGATPQTSSVPFTAPTTGVYYFGFNAYSSANQWKLFLDDIAVEVNLSNGGDFENSNFTFYPNPVKDVLNLSYKQNISNVSVYTLLGQKVLEKTIRSNTAQINLSGFASGSYIVKVTSENQTKIIKVIKE